MTATLSLDALQLMISFIPRPREAPQPTGSDVGPVLQALRRLSDSDQELLRLIAWEGLTHADVAAA